MVIAPKSQFGAKTIRNSGVLKKQTSIWEIKGKSKQPVDSSFKEAKSVKISEGSQENMLEISNKIIPKVITSVN